MSHNKQFLGITIPRREPVATPEQGDDAAIARSKNGGLMAFNPAAKEARFYAETMLGRLADLVDGVETLKVNSEKAYVFGTADASGAGVATIEIEAESYSYEIERIVTVCTGGAASVVIHLNEVSSASVIETVPNSLGPQLFADASGGNLFIPPNQKVLVVFTGLTAGTTAFFRGQAVRHIDKPLAKVGR